MYKINKHKMELLDNFIASILCSNKAIYYKFPEYITLQEWNRKIFPTIVDKCINDKLLLRTIPLFTPNIGCFFIKNVNNDRYKKQLERYYLFLDKGNIPGSLKPPLFRSYHIAGELLRNINILYKINLIIIRVKPVDGRRRKYMIIKDD